MNTEEREKIVEERILNNDSENVEMSVYLFRHLLGFPESYLANCLYFSSVDRYWNGSMKKAASFADYSATWTTKALGKMQRACLIQKTDKGYALNFTVSSVRGDFSVTMPEGIFRACEKVFKADLEEAISSATRIFEEGRDPDEVANVLVMPPEKE